MEACMSGMHPRRSKIAQLGVDNYRRHVALAFLDAPHAMHSQQPIDDSDIPMDGSDEQMPHLTGPAAELHGQTITHGDCISPSPEPGSLRPKTLRPRHLPYILDEEELKELEDDPDADLDEEEVKELEGPDADLNEEELKELEDDPDADPTDETVLPPSNNNPDEKGLKELEDDPDANLTDQNANSPGTSGKMSPPQTTQVILARQDERATRRSNRARMSSARGQESRDRGHWVLKAVK
ncbi:hypothetical protein FRC03_006549 [Tulasnella sp. 419]|nr:hypothetical protein FRC03_006549 [Tulasnella sp. 419]